MACFFGLLGVPGNQLTVAHYPGAIDVRALGLRGSSFGAFLHVGSSRDPRST